MRRALRPALPALYRIYGLTWERIETMPPPELDAVMDDFDALRRRGGPSG